jgi:hypothetical protein
MLWTERTGAGPGLAADVGDDWQSDVGYCRVWWAKLPDGEWAFITDFWYPVQGPGLTGIRRQTEYLVCTDQDRPGETATWRRTRFGRVDAQPSEAVAWELCNRVDTTDPVFDWDGRPF